MLQRQACVKLDAQNDELRRQLGEMAELTAENARLSNLLANAPRPHSNVATDERLGKSDELARLLALVEALHQQSNDIASLRSDTVATRAELKEARQAQNASRMASRNNSGAANGAPFEILEASYGTGRTNLEVSAALSDRIRGGSLKTVAGNQLAGDPDYGQVKSLTVVYRFGGMVLTNQYRENDIVILPPESP